MSKVITSPVKRWPGTVTLYEPLSYPQVLALEEVYRAREKLPEDATINQARALFVPAIIKCVESWQLEGNFPQNPTLDTFPASPKVAAAELLTWLINEVAELFMDADAIPNE